MSEAIQTKLNELADIVGAIQTKNDSFEKKYDGLVIDEMKRLTDTAVDLRAAIEESKEKEIEQKKRIDLLETIVARGGNGKHGEKTDLDKYNEALLGWFRKGVKISEEIAKKGLIDYFSAPGLSKEEVEMKTMQVGINPQGGYWVIPERLAATVGRSFETSPVRSVANVITTLSDSVELIIDDDESTQGGWTTETATRSQSAEPDIGLLQIYTHELYTLHKVTQKLLDDAGFNVGAWLLDKINMKLGRVANTAYVSGNGANKPKGFLDYAAWAAAGTYERNKIEQIASGAAAALTADGLIDLQNSLHEVYQPNATWMMRRQTWGSVIKLKESGTGSYLIDPQLLRNGDGQLVLLGQPVVFASDMPAVGAAALPVTYGDFRRGYTIVDKVGVNTIRDNITDKGRVIFYVSRRTGGAVTCFDCLKTQVVSL
jgi:HK97 family phage major capsid protein